MIKFIKVLITIMITSTAAQAEILKRDYVYDARVVSVYDGDTIRVDIDLGFNLWLHNESIRLITEKDDREKYGRYLGTIYLDNINLNEEMLNLGLAKKY